MNFNDQDKKDNWSNQSGQSRNDQNVGNEQNSSYESYIPSEIPIPDMEDTKKKPYGQNNVDQPRFPESSYGQNNMYQTRSPESSYEQNNPYHAQNTESPYGQKNPYHAQDTETPYGQKNPYHAQDTETPYGQNNPYQAQNMGPQGQMYIPRKKKSIVNKILIAAASVAVIVFAVVGIGMVYFRNTPAYKLGKGFQNLAKEIAQTRNPLAEKTGMEDIILMLAEEGSHVDTRINFTTESLFGTTVGIDTDYYKDTENKELSADTSISVMNYDFAHLNIYADDEAFCFSVPELFVENMYINNEDVVSQYNGSFLAELTGVSGTEDFSLNFFEDAEDRLSLREWESLDKFSKRYEADFEACREKIIMEKVEKGAYRIVYPAKETERLLRNLMDNYESAYEMAGAEQWWKEYDRLIGSDISVLFKINGQNHIESVAFEEPVVMMDGTASMEGSLHFLGDARSIDKLQGEIAVQGVDDVERGLHFQILQTPEDDSYKLDLDVELMEEADSVLRVKYVTNSDAVRDEFDMNFSVWDDEQDMEWNLEGSLDDIVKGRSLNLDLEEAVFYMDGEEVFKITGEFLIEPFDGEVTSTVKKETAFFEMTENDWMNILYKIDDAYGGLLNYLWY